MKKLILSVTLVVAFSLAFSQKSRYYIINVDKNYAYIGDTTETIDLVRGDKLKPIVKKRTLNDPRKKRKIIVNDTLSVVLEVVNVTKEYAVASIQPAGEANRLKPGMDLIKVTDNSIPEGVIAITKVRRLTNDRYTVTLNKGKETVPRIRNGETYIVKGDNGKIGKIIINDAQQTRSSGVLKLSNENVTIQDLYKTNQIYYVHDLSFDVKFSCSATGLSRGDWFDYECFPAADIGFTYFPDRFYYVNGGLMIGVWWGDEFSVLSYFGVGGALPIKKSSLILGVELGVGYDIDYGDALFYPFLKLGYITHIKNWRLDIEAGALGFKIGIGIPFRRYLEPYYAKKY